MSADILDVIDGALLDWETSGDAMRWVPERERAEKMAVSARGGTGAPVTLDLNVDISPFMDALADIQRVLAEAFGQLATAFGISWEQMRALANALGGVPDSKRAELSRMHRTYHQRQKARIRRNRGR